MTDAQMFDCPQCGEETETLNEGYCESCRQSNQNALDMHNSRFDHWERMSEAEKVQIIRKAIQ